jgi:hypothetical protein
MARFMPQNFPHFGFGRQTPVNFNCRGPIVIETRYSVRIFAG